MADRTITYRFKGDTSGLSASTRKASGDVRGLGTNLQAAGGHAESMGKRFRRVATGGAGLVAAFGIGKLVKDSVQLEASFSKTLSQIAVATGAPKSALKGLHDTAMKLGADTVFSANEAADAMLELAKSGISTRDIMKGGIQGTLTLAAAGSLDLATAATIASNAMNTFHLRGKDMGSIAAALAGGANASTASVESLGQALSQVGPGARNAGLSLQETVGTLAAFDQAGIKGSDAGTSLKTMLTRLIPSTHSAKMAMKDLGLSFVDQHGNIDDITVVAQKLQDKLSGLSQAQRSTALSTIFGSDATRAASVLMDQGAKGLAKFIKATKDQGAAQRMAKANMRGTAGALEQLSGSIDTAKLKLGEALAPTVRKLAHYLSATAVPAFSRFIDQMRSGKGAGGAVADTLNQIWQAGGKVAHVVGNIAKAFSSLPSWAKQTIAVGGIAAIGAKKLGLLPTLGKVANKTLGGKAGVTPVFVTNPGFGLPGKGGPGGVPVPGGGGPAGGAAGGGWKALLATALKNSPAGLSASGIGTEVQGPGDKNFDKNDVIGKAIVKYRRLDAALTSVSKNHPGAALQAYNTAFHKSGLSADLFARQVPKASRALDAFKHEAAVTHAEKMATDFTRGASKAILLSAALRKTGMSTQDYHKKLSSLPSQVATKVTTPGAVTSRRQAIALGHQYGLTPKQIRTLVQLAGVNAAVSAAAAARAAYASIPRNVNTHITVTRSLSALNPTASKPRPEPNAAGGYITGPGTATSDSIPAMLSNGEFVMRAAAVRKYGLDQMHQMNAMALAGGGLAGRNYGGSASTTRSSSDPVVVHVYDANDHLIGTMRGVAQGVADDSRDFDSTLARRSV